VSVYGKALAAFTSAVFCSMCVAPAVASSISLSPMSEPSTPDDGIRRDRGARLRVRRVVEASERICRFVEARSRKRPRRAFFVNVLMRAVVPLPLTVQVSPVVELRSWPRQPRPRRSG
jgi:hypothetical protein